MIKKLIMNRMITYEIILDVLNIMLISLTFKMQ